MSHVDEGLISAYLDGALDSDPAARRAVDDHVARCDACRLRLDDERRLHQRARQILSQSGPESGSRPPFAEITARAARQSVRRPRRPWFGPQGLAWAATVALALGVGWYAGLLQGGLRRTLLVGRSRVAQRHGGR
jgi:anti-sigma factor RsiW